jgi:hypothetical protein
VGGGGGGGWRRGLPTPAGVAAGLGGGRGSEREGEGGDGKGIRLEWSRGEIIHLRCKKLKKSCEEKPKITWVSYRHTLNLILVVSYTKRNSVCPS